MFPPSPSFHRVPQRVRLVGAARSSARRLYLAFHPFRGLPSLAFPPSCLSLRRIASTAAASSRHAGVCCYVVVILHWRIPTQRPGLQFKAGRNGTTRTPSEPCLSGIAIATSNSCLSASASRFQLRVISNSPTKFVTVRARTSTHMTRIPSRKSASKPNATTSRSSPPPPRARFTTHTPPAHPQAPKKPLRALALVRRDGGGGTPFSIQYRYLAECPQTSQSTAKHRAPGLVPNCAQQKFRTTTRPRSHSGAPHSL